MEENLNKKVTYKIQGDNTGLIKTIESALKKLDTLDTKIARIASRKDISPLGEGQERDALLRTGTLSTALSKLETVKDILSTADVSVLTKGQVALIKAASSEINTLLKSVGKASEAGSKTQENINQYVKRIDLMKKSLKNAGIAAVGVEKEVKKHFDGTAQRVEVTQKALKNFEKYTKEYSKTQKQLLASLKKAVIGVINIVRKLITLNYKAMAYASDFGETLNKFNVVAGQSAEVLGDFAEKMSDLLGLDLQDMYEAVATFKSISNSINLANKQSEIFSITLTKLAVDLASLYNTSTERAITALSSGLHGVLKPLKSYNIYLYETNLEQTALQIGLNRNIDSLNESEKILLRYITILKQSTEAQGDMARTLTSSANQLRILQAQFAQLKRSFGQIATAITLVLVPALNVLLGGLTKVFTFIAKSLGYEIENFANIFGDSTDSIEDSENALNSYADTARGLSGLDEINLIRDAGSSNIIDPETGGLTIDQTLMDALKGYNNQMDQISGKMSDITDKIAETLQDTLVADVFNLTLKAIKGINESLAFVVDHWDAFAPLLKTVLNLLTIVVGLSIASKIKTWGVAVVGLITKLKALSVTLQGTQALTTGFGVDAVAATTKISGLTMAFGALALAASYAVFSSIFNQFSEKTKQIIGIIGTLVSALTIGAMAWMAYHGAMTLGVAVPVIGAAIGLGIASIKAAIPALATGGIVDQPTVAMIGEGKYSEAVVPLGNSPQFKTMKEDIAASVVSSLAQTPTYSDQLSRRNTPVILQVNGKEFARAILPDLSYGQLQTGVKLR